jgi:hypothetical protein
MARSSLLHILVAIFVAIAVLLIVRLHNANGSLSASDPAATLGLTRG